MTPKTAVVIIPARYEASRFPGKPLYPIAGKPLVRHVYDRVKLAKLISDVIVATDDERILKAVQGFGGKAVMTSASHPTGTDRIAEAAQNIQCDLIVNVQGDEPLMDPQLIDRAISHFGAIPGFKFGTAMTPLTNEEDINNPNVVKVVATRDMRALYFSRHAIPYRRKHTAAPVYQHIGFYVYSRKFLFDFQKMEPAPLETAESLEQLRALENGVRIDMLETPYRGIGVDSLEDVARIEWELKRDTPPA